MKTEYYKCELIFDHKTEIEIRIIFNGFDSRKKARDFGESLDHLHLMGVEGDIIAYFCKNNEFINIKEDQISIYMLPGEKRVKLGPPLDISIPEGLTPIFAPPEDNSYILNKEDYIQFNGTLKDIWKWALPCDIGHAIAVEAKRDKQTLYNSP